MSTSDATPAPIRTPQLAPANDQSANAGSTSCEGAPVEAAPTVVHVMTVPMSLAFLARQVTYMRKHGFRVHVVTSPGPELAEFAEREGITFDAVRMPRAQLAPVRDLLAVIQLRRIIRRVRPDIVHSHTPKGGLLGMVAAAVSPVPVRIYHLRGLRFETVTGIRRWLLRLAERTSCALAHRVIAVSRSMRDVAIAERLCAPDKIEVLLDGSGNGVDADGRFRPQPAAVRAAERARWNIPEDAVVIGFVGRLSRDKGVVELSRAWNELRTSNERLHLVLVGWDELEQGLEHVGAALRADPRVHITGPERDTPRLYAAMDVVALPTYREGFPNVALEAAAMELPIVATAVTGCVDAVEDGVTGTLVAPRSASALAAALHAYCNDPCLRARHGAAARRRVLATFRSEAVWEALATEYRRLLAPPR